MNKQEQVQQTRRMGVGMMVLAWLVALGLGVLFFSDVLESQINPNRGLQAGSNSQEVVLKRNKYGHYVATGAINGQPVVFMLDTGATGVAIPEKIATQLGLRGGRAMRTQTANGVAVSYAVSLDRVGLGGIELRDVRAAIAPGLQTEQVLLGMSFLKHIEFTQRGDTLILRQ